MTLEENNYINRYNKMYYVLCDCHSNALTYHITWINWGLPISSRRLFLTFGVPFSGLPTSAIFCPLPPIQVQPVARPTLLFDNGSMQLRLPSSAYALTLVVLHHIRVNNRSRHCTVQSNSYCLRLINQPTHSTRCDTNYVAFLTSSRTIPRSDGTLTRAPHV